ncbi:NAD-dependent deacetylase [Xanthomonas phaseoli pv. phaseoli]|uniref:NAD-dependent protein deacetylase n=2 Tax=Xanthomonas TaxID=338 RepID=A0AAX0I3W6_XANCG|nr:MULTISPECIES: NAD-dependent protein deacetylase [Xanthomonas]OOW58272.1 NAD-dependent deacetylase [Xanthomonas campestris pv. centellae]OOW90279.1 NAD-dependent deacetylase [Xanthomonas campestris pv. vitistrifoliae]OOW96864.1 NAD-dependent deacetylase [Xanthomonas campestris pv. vitiscarnosae]AOY60730.1 NAD-dependent protein deacetylase [Xanthomonas citri pv. glycines str. 8ra]ARV21369.1 NAD-dependent deacetylase [Xanthomonas citri pv. glycines str. 12-2]
MTAVPAHDHHTLQDFIERHQRLFVLTGAGCSTDSGIPDYRDLQGGWKRPQPVTFQAFMGELSTRQRYWARSLVGWPRFGLAQPNATHHALAALEARGQLEVLLTQNVDRLHQAAGSQAVIDLHGRLDVVRCMGCERRMPRTEFQVLLEQANPGWAALEAAQAPDGDADLDDVAFEHFVVPPCPVCGGVLKPDVVFFGENVPRARVERAFAHLQAADAVLVVGSSLMVYSGFRFVQTAARNGLPIAALNFGRTRADELLTLKVEQSCAQALAFLHAPPHLPRARSVNDASARSA